MTRLDRSREAPAIVFTDMGVLLSFSKLSKLGINMGKKYGLAADARTLQPAFIIDEVCRHCEAGGVPVRVARARQIQQSGELAS
jgi:hypothetical protein